MVSDWSISCIMWVMMLAKPLQYRIFIFHPILRSFLAHLSKRLIETCPSYTCPLVRLYVVSFSHFNFFRTTACMLNHHMYHKCPSRGPEEVLYLTWAIKNPRCLPWPRIVRNIFDFFSRPTTMWSSQTCQKHSSFDHQKVFFLCRVIRNPTWLSSALIVRDIFDFVSQN